MKAVDGEEAFPDLRRKSEERRAGLRAKSVASLEWSIFQGKSKAKESQS